MSRREMIEGREPVPISIIIPVYNKARYLPVLFSQIHTQTFRDFECLLIDDGSTDGSSAVCDDFADRDDRVRVLHIPNGGVSNARNVGLDNARGEYLTFLDSDDQIHPEYLENLYRCAEESGADLVISGFAKTDAEGRILARVVPQELGLVDFSQFLPRFAAEQKQTGIFGYCFSKLYRSSTVGDARFDRSLRLAEDLDFNLNLYQSIRTVWFDDHTLYDYLQNAENSSVQLEDERIDYLAQLRVSLRYRVFLMQVNCYENGSRQIVDTQITNFLYLSLLYCPKGEFVERFRMLRNLLQQDDLKLHPRGWRQCIVLGLLRLNAGGLLSLTIRTYHTTRKILRRLRNG